MGGRQLRRRETLVTHLVALLLAAVPAEAPAPAPAPPAPVRYELVDRVIATVAKDAITLSDLERQARVILILRGGPQALGGLNDAGFVASVMDFLTNQLLIVQEMRKQAGYAQGAGEDDAREELKKFVAKFADQAAYKQFLQLADISEDSIKDLLLKNLRVERFLETKSRQASQVTDEEAEDEFRKSPGQFPGKKFNEVAAQVKSFMMRARAEKFVREYLADLRQKYEVRVLAVPK